MNGEEFIKDKTIYNGRPNDISNRLEKEVKVYDLLDKLSIQYQRLDHDAVFSINECNARGEILGINISKNLFLCNTQKNQFHLLVMPGNKKFKTNIFSKQISSPRLSFAPEEYMIKYLNTTPGSVSIMSLMNDTENKVKLYFDKDVINQEYFGCHPCINTSSLKFKMKDIINIFLPAVKHQYRIVELPNE